ncbi:hypothetical protein FAGAP_6620 [Fusarium agapanthi]|uniref:Uncharacterized protein n=1 Tax=Fusarium agapanthi TaxID=1803897 RepID=A0A9P5B7U9_9HYPO|nr:hypothetical protein FAGAP_6620 [Fusarium agapanthi]
MCLALSPRFYFGAETDTLLVSIYIDGNLVEESLVFKSLLREQDFIEYISHRHREDPNGSISTHTFSFQDLAHAECTTAATLQADIGEEQTFDSLQPSTKALILNGYGQTHGTGYKPVDVPVHFEYYDVDIREAIGCFDFVYLSPDTLEAQGIMNPDYINQAAQGMPQTLDPAPEPPRYAFRTMSNGCVEIDLTNDDE